MRVLRRFVVALVAAGLGAPGCLPELREFPPESTGLRCGDGFVALAASGGEQCDPGEGGAVGCSRACVVECAGGTSVATRHCYFVAAKAASYQEAAEACRAASAHVVTFVGDDEIRSVEAAAPAGEYWVGLTKDFTGVYTPEGRDEPGFPEPPDTGPCPGCFARASATGTFPDVAGQSGQGCLVATPGLREPWRRVSCTKAPKAYDVVCEREPPGQRSEPCTGGICVRLPFTEKRYLYVAQLTSANGAQEGCVALGGRLVTLESPEEREELSRELARYAPEQGVWVGLARRAQDGPFTWEDGKPETLVLWGDREPDRDGAPKGPVRAFLDLRGGRYDTRLLRAAHDDKPRGYLCQY